MAKEGVSKLRYNPSGTTCHLPYFCSALLLKNKGGASSPMCYHNFG